MNACLGHRRKGITTESGATKGVQLIEKTTHTHTHIYNNKNNNNKILIIGIKDIHSSREYNEMRIWYCL